MALDRKEFEQFVSNAQIALTGASENGIKAALYDVLKEFYSDSGAWMEDIEFIPLANVDEYSLAPAQEGQLLRLVGVWDNKGLPVSAFMPDFGRVKLLHAPANSGNADNKWTARFEKTVTLPTTRENIPIAPDWTLRVYSPHILDGVFGKMMAQPGKSYSNDSKAAYHLRRFRVGIAMARTAAKRMNNVGAQAWAYPRGFGRGSQRGNTSTAWPTRAF